MDELLAGFDVKGCKRAAGQPVG